jgi:hypothetical protein
VSVNKGKRLLGSSPCLMTWGVLVLSLVLLGCRRSSPPSPAPAAVGRLVQLRVRDRSPTSSGVVDTTALTARATEQLRTAGVLPVALDAPPRRGSDYRLDIDIAFEQAPSGEQGTLRALVAARLQRIGAADAPLVSQALAERAYGRGETEEPVEKAGRAHLERALGDVLKGLIAKVRLHQGDPQQLLAALSDGDFDLRAEAIRAAGLRRERAAMPQLVQMLKSEDADLRDLALGALVEIGDRSVVPAITRAAQFRDVHELPKILDAVAALGGDEAQAYLEFVATSHDQAEIRELAREAQGRFARRHAPPDQGAPAP